VVVHTTPIAVPVSATIDEPDIPPRTRSAARAIHSGPPKWRMVQENHRPSSDSSRADAQKSTGARTPSVLTQAPPDLAAGGYPRMTL
jgi:hypothetical protein